MKKIKSVKLLKDLPGCNAGATFKFNPYLNYLIGFVNYHIKEIKSNPDFFDITYEEDFFEVENEPHKFIILSDGTIYDTTGHNNCQYKYGNAGTRAEMEYRKMHNETMHYFRKLAEELNGEWRYEVGKRYNELMLQPNKPLGLYPRCDFIRNSIKFNPELTTDQITSRAKPEMLENYKRICQNPY